MKKALKKIISRIQKQIILTVYYGKKISFHSKNEKEIVICFDGNFAHGGLVDRIKGIITLYEVAKKLGYSFKVYFNNPFSLQEFLLPNEVDWTINEIKFHPLRSKIFYLMDQFDVDPLKLIKKSKATTFFVYANVDLLGQIYPGKIKEELEVIWRNNYHELFKVSSLLESELAKLPLQERVTFHSRFTSLMGDFDDTSKKNISEEEKQILLRKLVQKIDFQVGIHQGKEIYVLSDSTIFLNFIKHQTTYKVLEGVPKHMDIKNNDSSRESHLKTFLDFYFIVFSDTVYLLKLDRMYNSGFSKYAAIVGNKEFKIIS